MKWYSGSIPEAVAEAKRNNKLFLVYIEGTDDMSRTMTDTYNDSLISKKLSANNIIALKLTANSVPYVQFCAIYPVIIIPSSYFIGVNGAPIEIITGSLIPSEFSVKIDKIIEIHEKSSPSINGVDCQPSTSKVTDSTQSKEKNIDPNQPSTSQASVDCQPSKTKVSDSTPQEKNIDPNQPSTSEASEEEVNIAAAPLEERLERAKALLEVKKQLQENEEKEKERKQELERRSVGKALQKAQQEKQDNELKEWAKNRAKEKEEERLAREKVLALIEQDKADRAARYQQTKDAEQAEKERLAKIREEQERAARVAAMNSNEARIQFRLPDGSSTNHAFSADASLDDVRTFVKNEVRPPFSYFSLCTTFPRRHFTQSDYSESLRDLQLAPSAVLLILPEQSVTHSHSSGGFWSMVLWILSPLLYTWRTITSFFFGTSNNSNQTNQPVSDPPNNQNEQRSSQSVGGVRRRDTSFVRQEGNIFRLNNQSDDGENNTWNGNSTQQM